MDLCAVTQQFKQKHYYGYGSVIDKREIANYTAVVWKDLKRTNASVVI
jgi:hypothetical protein